MGQNRSCPDLCCCEKCVIVVLTKHGGGGELKSDKSANLLFSCWPVLLSVSLSLSLMCAPRHFCLSFWCLLLSSMDLLISLRVWLVWMAHLHLISLCFFALERLIMSSLPSHISPLDWNSTNSSCWTGRKSSYLILSLPLPSPASKRSGCLLYTSCK